ncbi:hypothetical protein GGH99_005464 [Coemansia sp. RSA 1285]|nr:hypothetical protein GGH99_005464 [Coemansia sp. RSA 1285]
MNGLRQIRQVIGHRSKLGARQSRWFSASVGARGGSGAEPSVVQAGMVLQRNPILMQQATGFEAVTDEYFGWLDYVTAERFPRDFFFKKGSTVESRWMVLEDKRADQWYFDAKSKPARKQSKPAAAEGEDLLGTDADAGKGSAVNTVEVHPRLTTADASGDTKLLERKLDRTLYLLVKKNGQWVFPQGAVQTDEALSQAARRNLKETCGDRMDVWTVGHGPIGHHEAGNSTTFFVKGHILRGQAKSGNNGQSEAGAADFRWATREEVETAVAPEYWLSVKDMLSSV